MTRQRERRLGARDEVCPSLDTDVLTVACILLTGAAVAAARLFVETFEASQSYVSQHAVDYLRAASAGLLLSALALVLFRSLSRVNKVWRALGISSSAVFLAGFVFAWCTLR
jgi:hypothetical protein